MSDELVKSIKALITSDNCPHCSDMKEMLKEKGLLDKIKVIRYETPEGKEFCEKNGITSVPECVIMENGNGEKARVCSTKEFGKLLESGE